MSFIALVVIVFNTSLLLGCVLSLLMGRISKLWQRRGPATSTPAGVTRDGGAKTSRASRSPRLSELWSEAEICWEDA